MISTVWTHLRSRQYFKQHGNNEHEWARRFYLQVRSIRELDDMITELKRRLSHEGIEALEGNSPWNKHEIPLLLKRTTTYPNSSFGRVNIPCPARASLAPHALQFSRTCRDSFACYCTRSGDEAREREATKILGGNDPRYTVYLKDFPTDQPGPVYASSIKNIIKKYTGDEPRVTFDQNSSKVFLSFTKEDETRPKGNTRNPTIPGKVVLPVYKALKIRQLKIDVRVALLPPEKAKEIANCIELQNKTNLSNNELVPKLPDIDDTHFPIKISQFINCGYFWAQYDDDDTMQELQIIQKALNMKPLLVYAQPPRVGDLLVAPYQDESGTQYYRVCVHKILPKDMVWVFYIDYGSCGRVNVCNLFSLPSGICQELPPLAMECTLAEVAPSLLLDVHGQWTEAATIRFRQLVSKGRLIAKVYSVTHGVVSIKLLAENGRLSINKDLVEKGLAQPADESYESKMNHDLRASAADLNIAQKRAYNREQIHQAFQAARELEPPSPRDCVTDTVLKGPFSPLESTVYSMMYGSQQKRVNIEWNSVNSVLLDTEPQETYERLLVAGTVGQSTGGDRLTLRHTTLMPHVPGLPAIITMLFCPTMELRRDEQSIRYVCALVGLGSDDDGHPLFPEHDMLLNIDVDLSVEDIGMINHVRHLMDYMMFCGEGQDGPSVDDELRPRVPAIIRQNLVNLLWRRRKHRESCVVPGAWNWRTAPEQDMLEVADADMVDRAAVYPLHTPLELCPLDQDTALSLKRANDKLKIEVTRTHMSSNKQVSCVLCGTGAMSTQAMRIHLYSRAHREREDDFRMFDS
ncbi:Probable ATP-dependent RNA helicase spindle-E [Eumeta japonica]|uniref:Probable ATP-dependent RNA helicase spindle-E n=1 Tax=Eumeta variegata TaxID=151549 RepID=A0A4C1SS95_EUMVA|nr:Probable ATP-dependent RNA helicase spindle-E [Eumeta japonica]